MNLKFNSYTLNTNIYFNDDNTINMYLYGPKLFKYKIKLNNIYININNNIYNFKGIYDNKNVYFQNKDIFNTIITKKI